MHVTASTREGELTALRKRAADEWLDDEASVVEEPPDRIAAELGRADLGTSRHARPSSVYAEHPRARGPPRG